MRAEHKVYIWNCTRWRREWALRSPDFVTMAFILPYTCTSLLFVKRSSAAGRVPKFAVHTTIKCSHSLMHDGHFWWSYQEYIGLPPCSNWCHQVQLLWLYEYFTTGTSYSIGNYCKLPSDKTSKDNDLVVVFKSDGSTTADGFSLDWTAIPPEGEYRIDSCNTRHRSHDLHWGTLGERIGFIVRNTVWYENMKHVIVLQIRCSN
jgi:hypothetical protein